MAQTISPTTQAQSIANFASGSWTGDGTITTLKLGFRPRFIEIYNATDATKWTWMVGQAATNTIKVVTAGTMTTDSTSAIVDNADGTVAVSAAAGASAKAMIFAAWG